jgi:tRNA A37 threonylcarbamoyladenosine dehydratase
MVVTASFGLVAAGHLLRKLADSAQVAAETRKTAGGLL